MSTGAITYPLKLTDAIALFKDSTYIFSYTALLIMAPFLAFVVPVHIQVSYPSYSKY